MKSKVVEMCKRDELIHQEWLDGLTPEERLKLEWFLMEFTSTIVMSLPQYNHYTRTAQRILDHILGQNIDSKPAV